MTKREVFVLESNGQPKRAVIEESELARLGLTIEAGVRIGIPVGQEQIVRYVPEHANLWLFQANENWTETQLTNTGPLQPLLQQAVDGEPWTFSLYFVAPDWDAAKLLMDAMQGHRVGSYVEHIVPEPKSLKERKTHYNSRESGHRFRSGNGRCLKCGLERGHYFPHLGTYKYKVDGHWTGIRPKCPGNKANK